MEGGGGGGGGDRELPAHNIALSTALFPFTLLFINCINPLNPELNPICYLLGHY